MTSVPECVNPVAEFMFVFCVSARDQCSPFGSDEPAVAAMGACWRDCGTGRVSVRAACRRRTPPSPPLRVADCPALSTCGLRGPAGPTAEWFRPGPPVCTGSRVVPVRSTCLQRRLRHRPTPATHHRPFNCDVVAISTQAHHKDVALAQRCDPIFYITLPH